MILPKEPREIKSKSPRVLTLFGLSKIGKTPKLPELENCLIIDTENGAEKIKGLIVEVNSLTELSEVIKTLKENNPYKYVALDTIDNVVFWVENNVCNRRNVSAIGDIGYGAGYDEVRSIVFKYLQALKSICNRLIIIGHEKKTIIEEGKAEIKIITLDLTGRLKNMIFADSDAVGNIFRDKEMLKIRFQNNNFLEGGSRCEHLANKVIDFNWKQIYID